MGVCRLIGAVAAIGALAAAPPLLAQPPSPPPRTAAQTGADALVRLLYPPEMVDLQVPIARRAFLAGIASDAEMQKLSATYPGLVDAMWAAVAPALRADFALKQPRLWAQLAALYAARLTPAEIEGLRSFYAGATGQKLLRTMFGAVDAGPMIRDVLNRPDGQVSGESAARVVADAKAKTLASIPASLTAEDKAAYARLAKTVTAAKAEEISREAQKLILDWVNEPDPAQEARIQKIVVAVGTRYIAAHKR